MAGKKMSEDASCVGLDELERMKWAPGKPPFMEEATGVCLERGSYGIHVKENRCFLDGEWQMVQGEVSGYEDISWEDGISALIPCSVHTALFQAGKIPDPMVGMNDTVARENSYKTWWFRRSFFLKEGSQYDEIVFQGVCYHARFWLNGCYLGEHKGMFTEFTFDVSSILEEDNELVVCILNAPYKSAPMSPYMDNDDGWMQGTVINCVYGWHYACIPSRGIWKSVYLRKEKPAIWMEKPFVMTENASKGKIHLCLELCNVTGKEKIRGEIHPENFEGETFCFEKMVEKEGEKILLNLTMEVPSARLWWPLHYGKQDMYRLIISMDMANGESQVEETVFGIRTVHMEFAEGQTREQYKWLFVINEKQLFIKGSNWCTTDALLRFPEERYERFLTLAAEENIQLLRAWGGGMPEDDIFYSLCDRLGIMVIQEWPTCWDSQKVQPLEELVETVKCHMPRLRNHPSLVMWCGGNESRDADGMAMEQMLKLAYELDGSRPFHRTEPFGGSIHDYSTYWDMQDIDRSLELNSVFLGEFGIASAPVYDSVMRYLPKEEREFWPPERFGSFGHHTPRFNQLEPDDMAHMRKCAEDFANLESIEYFIWATQMAQATGIRHTLENYRCRFPEAAGVCYYKLTDVYPACSWSTIDYYGVPKLSYYVLQDSYEPFHACLMLKSTRIRKNWKVPVYLLDDGMESKDKEVRVEICAYDETFRKIATEQYVRGNKADRVSCLGSFSLKDKAEGLVMVVLTAFINGVRKDGTFYWLNYHEKPGCLLELPRTSLEWNAEGDFLEIRNIGDYPAVGVTAECPTDNAKFCVEDGMFWMEPGEVRKIWASSILDIRVKAFNVGENRFYGMNCLMKNEIG